MKKIEAIIRKNKLQDVMSALVKHGINAMTVIEVQGRGSEPRPTIAYRGATAEQPLVPHIKIEIIVDEGKADSVLDVIFQNAHTGASGDGRILVTNLESVVRIRTGEVSDATTDVDEVPGARGRAQQVASQRTPVTPLGAPNWAGPRTFAGTDEAAMSYWLNH